MIFSISNAIAVAAISSFDGAILRRFLFRHISANRAFGNRV
jgi:hypothetical protein